MTEQRNAEFKDLPWKLIETYFNEQHLQRLVRHQIESYNNFINNEIQKTINMFNPVHIHSENDYSEEFNKYKLELVINFDNFNLYRPKIHENNGATKTMFPHKARLRNFTYSSNMVIDFNIKIILRSGKDLKDTQTFYKKMEQIHIGKNAYYAEVKHLRAYKISSSKSYDY